MNLQIQQEMKMKISMKRIFATASVFFAVAGCAMAEDAVLSYEGYNLKWEDNFDGTELDRNNWNVELHEKGWVNNELQTYVDSEENIIVKDGKLILKPVTKNAKKQEYTSGRVNTQNKHDFKYGLFECLAKVPKGKGFLPAFWMMPTDESFYGQWPCCGEIDIMEVVGSDTSKAFGTVHYGSPHAESQGSIVLGDNAFSDEFHLFSCEWEPGKLTWYVDGKKIHTENDWFTATEGKKTLPYPAPFNQPFYLILNLAVGGNWPGNPDKKADYIDSSTFEIDYVRVYQKDSYNENVEKPKKILNMKKADATGNFISNGNFSEKEDLSDDSNWIFMKAQGGDGSAQIENSEIKILTQKAGLEEYSIQLVQPGLPLVEGMKYKVTFKARSDKKRTMKVAVTAPKRSWKRYLKDTSVKLDKEYKEYKYEFSMNDSDEDSARLEFNMGKTSSRATIYITDIRVEEAGKAEKKVLNYNAQNDTGLIKNSSFDDELEYYEIYVDSSASAECITADENTNLYTRFQINNTGDQGWKIQLMQKNVALEEGRTYRLKLSAKSDIDRNIMFAIQKDGSKDNDWNNYGTETVVKINSDWQIFEKEFSIESGNPSAMLSISLGAVCGKKISKPHNVDIDNVSLEVIK